MKIERVGEMRRTFGDDTLFLIGGALLEQGLNIEEDARAFAQSAGRDFLSAVPEANLQDNKPSGAISESTGASSQFASSVEEVERVATAVRRRVLDYTIRNNGGYLSQACSSAETLATLYLRALNLGPSIAPVIPGPFRGSPGPEVETITGEGHNGDFRDPNLDRLIFSPVHYALVLYSLLVEIGRLDVKAFESYNKDGSTVELIGAEHSPGHAVTAGSLAQALSQAAGIAYARKLKGHTGRVCVYMSDGEFQVCLST
jgi:transketolase